MSHTGSGCRCASVFLALVLLWPGAAADDLPPGILLLSRIKRHMREEIAHLPDYTCLQTVRRFRDKGPADTVVLQVLYAGGKELYASPGTRDSGTQDRGRSPAADSAEPGYSRSPCMRSS